MNSVERILATLAGKPVDRRAAAPVLCLYGARLTGCPLDRYYTDPAAYAAGQAAVRATFQPDILFGPFDFAGIGAAFGSELHWVPQQPPNVRRPAIRTVAEWEKLALPDPDTHPRLVFLREAVRRMAAEHRGQVLVAAVLPPPIDLPVLVMGMDAWMETVLFDADAAKRVMEKIVPFFVHLANGLFADGAAFVALPCGFASPAVVTREMVTTFARPVLADVLAQLRGPVVLHHTGAPLLAHLDLLAGLPSVVAFGMDERDDLRQARQVAGSDPVLFGGPMAPRLPGLTAAQVESEGRAWLENRREDARFLLYTSGADVPWHTPPENIHALRQAAEAFGGSAR